MRGLPYVTGIAGLVGGLTLGWWAYRPVQALEGPAPEVRLQSGAVVLRRDPAAKPPSVPQDAPGVLTRYVGLDLDKNLPVSRLDLFLMRQPDATTRVVASSDGRILGGIDIPVQPTKTERVPKWALGVTYSFEEKGALVLRDLGPFQVGVEAVQRKVGNEVRLKALWRF